MPKLVETALDPASYYKSEARPVGKLKSLFIHSGADVSFEKWLNFRDSARKDLYWLGKEVLRKDLTKCHLDPCYGLFVQKNFDGVYHEGYTIGEVHFAIDKQKREKDMLWLDPRGAFKSTLDGIDCVQWMLNCPDIRILILTGEYKLALAFMSEIKGYFYRPSKTVDGKVVFTDDPSLLQQLFPEYVLTGKDGTSDQPLECPARVHNQKEPSLWVNAIVANLSGWHCDIRKMDDVVTDENSNSIDARGPEGKLKMKIDGTDNLVDEWGFTDTVGTRYYTDDYYGERIRARGPEAPLRYLCRACWTVKEEFLSVPLMQLKSEMVDLLFPEKLTFRSLRQKLSKNEIMFRCQQLNEPAGDMDAIAFSEDVLRAHIVAKAPEEGKKFIAWDTSYARDSKADYSAGICGLVVTEDDRSELYLVDIIFGKWKPSELIFQLVQFELKHRPERTLVEEMNGVEFMKEELARVARNRQCPLNIIWKTPDRGPDAKRNRIKSLETLLQDNRLYFCSGNWIDETFAQFLRYTGERKNKGRKDDIPDAIAYLQFFVPSTANHAELKRLEHEKEEKERQKAIYDHIFTPPTVTLPPREAPSLKRQLFGYLANA